MFLDPQSAGVQSKNVVMKIAFATNIYAYALSR